MLFLIYHHFFTLKKIERSILLQVSKRLQFWKLPGSKTFNSDNFAFLIQMWFYFFNQNMQLEVLYNSTVSEFPNSNILHNF
jgi:hypothetical protein